MDRTGDRHMACVDEKYKTIPSHVHDSQDSALLLTDPDYLSAVIAQRIAE
jgi:hypothetical protein